MTRFYLVLLFWIASNVLIAQECVGTFIFHHQSDMDSFILNNPNCTTIIGDVVIEPQNTGGGDDLLSVNGLQNITHINGNLSIGFQGNSSAFQLSLASLANLESVTGMVFIGDQATEPHLISLEGFESLTFCEELFIQDCYGIESLEPFYQLEQTTGIACVWTYSIPKSISLTNLFPNLTLVSGGIAFEGASYPEFTGFDNLLSANSISISGYDSFANESIENFDAFPELLSCFSVYIEMDITEMQGFESLQNITFMSIHVNSLNPYWNFESLSYAVEIELKNDMSCLSTPTFPALTELDGANGGIRTLGLFENVIFSSLQSTGYFDVMGDGLGNGPTTIQCPELTVIHGDLLIAHTEIYDVQFLNSVNMLGAFVSLNSNHNLSLCDQEVLCYKIANDPFTVFIYDNASGCYDLAEASSNCNYSTAQGIVFIDLNCDGILNDQDYNYPQTVILQNQNGVAVEIYNPGQVYSLPLNQGSQVITLVAPDGYTTNNTYTYLENDPGNFIDQNYVLCPEPNLNNIELVIVPEQSPRPGFSNSYLVHVTNLGISEATAQITIDFSSASGMSIQSASGNGIINGEEVMWTTPSLSAFDIAIYHVECLVDASVPLGEIYTITGSANITMPLVNDSYPDNNQSVVTQTVIGSYDPNDISVNRVNLNSEELTASNAVELEYTIRFQNTGTASAINVKIENHLDEKLDLTSLHVVASSHEFSLAIEEDGNLIWSFDNVNLPDSNTNEALSHGYIVYQISTTMEVIPEDTITNFANIYFDYNLPILTNTAITTFYVCPSATEIIGPDIICQNDVVSYTCSDVFDEYSWSVDENIIADDAELIISELEAGLHNISMIASTEFCTSEVTHSLLVNAIPSAPQITIVGNTLSASGNGDFYWQVNGVDLSANSSAVDVTESGSYEVYVVIDGCASPISSGQFIIESIEENINAFHMIVFPQPAKNQINISISGVISGVNSISIEDASGRVVYSTPITSATTTIECSAMESGLYVCCLKTERNELIAKRKLILE